MNRRKFLGVCAGAAATGAVVAKSGDLAVTSKDWARGYVHGIKSMKKHEARTIRWVKSENYYDFLRAGWKDYGCPVSSENKHLWHLMVLRCHG